jgi:ribose 5-phosphate isomerase A
VHELQISDPAAMEAALNNIVGVVCNGVFAAQAANLVLVAGSGGTSRL